MGRDRGKFNKRGGRGGRGSRFQATSADEIELRNDRVAQFDAARAKRRDEAAEEENAGGGGNSNNNDDSGGEEISKGVATIKVKPATNEPRELTRKEREEKETARKAADYRRRHELGLTEEYKRDMAKLALVKKRREEQQERAAAEKEQESALELEVKKADKELEEVEGKKKKKSKGKKGEEEVPKLDKIVIKKMKPSQLKEALKERKLEIQGNSKALTERLLAYEAAR